MYACIQHQQNSIDIFFGDRKTVYKGIKMAAVLKRLISKCLLLSGSNLKPIYKSQKIHSVTNNRTHYCTIYKSSTEIK